jgi:hypothetical protein
VKRVALVILLSACAAEKKSEYYGATTSSDLLLSASNHPHGWTRSSCFGCHVESNIHQINRMNHPSFGSAKHLVDAYGVASCRGCHGSNGVSP